MKPILRVITFSSKLKNYYIAISVFTIILGLLSLVAPLASKYLFESITAMSQGNGGKTRLALISIVAIGLAEILNVLLGNILGYVGDQMTVKLRSFLSIEFYKKTMRLPMSFFDEQEVGKISSQLERGVNSITQFMNFSSNNMMRLLATTILGVLILFIKSWPIGLAIAISFPVYYFLTKETSKKWQKIQEYKTERIDAYNGRFGGLVAQMRIVKSFVTEHKEIKHITTIRSDIEKVNSKQSMLWHSTDVMRMGLIAVMVFLIYLYIYWQIKNGKMTIGDFAMITLLINTVRTPMNFMSFLVDNTQATIVDSKAYFDIIDTPETLNDKPNAKDLVISKGGIEFNDIGFGFDKKKILKKINFNIKPGQKIAIIGESGEGKSTIVNLLLRFYDPQEGKILIDGQNIGDITQSSLRENIAVVFQDPALFAGTVLENITYGSKKNITKPSKEVIAAAKMANAHDFIMKLPDGYNTAIGERGVKLSGGQKQRIAIARAALKDAPILVLDEATSSLDNKSEVLVQRALESSMKDRTSIIIAHRLSTISGVDQIVVVKDGFISEMGSPAQLSGNKSSFYSQMLSLYQDMSRSDVSAKQKESDIKKLKQFDIV